MAAAQEAAEAAAAAGKRTAKTAARKMRISEAKRFCNPLIFIVFIFLLFALPGRNIAFAALPPQKSEDADIAAARSDLEAAQRDLAASATRSKALQAEEDALKKEKARLREDIAAAVKAERAAAEESAAGARHLQELSEQKQQSQGLLDRERAEMAEILAGAEKLSLNHPPALLVSASDAAQSRRAAVMLGSLLPQMQEKVQSMQKTMQALADAEATLQTAQQELAALRERRQAEQKRLAFLLEQKAELQRKSRCNLQKEEKRRKELEEKAQSLQDLLGELEKERRRDNVFGGGKDKDTAPLLRRPFSALRGALPLPADGRFIARFGALSAGKSSQGEIMETKPAAIVSTPADSIVRYAGQFRSYGQVLILDVGENYYMILSGMERIDAEVGEILRQSDPVGKMSGVLPTDKNDKKAGKIRPRLYIEIRKDGRSVNPASWWARSG